MVQTKLKRWTVEEYYKMGELGLFHPEEKTELLDGIIILMSVQSPLHAATTEISARVLLRMVESQGLGLVRIEKPIELNNFSQVIPDIAIVAVKSNFYCDHHPTPRDIFWLIEVSDSTLSYDLNDKALAYANANIGEYWVLNVNQRQLHVLRSPSGDGYQEVMVLSPTDQVSPIAFPDVSFLVGSMLV